MGLVGLVGLVWLDDWSEDQACCGLCHFHMGLVRSCSVWSSYFQGLHPQRHVWACTFASYCTPAKSEEAIIGYDYTFCIPDVSLHFRLMLHACIRSTCLFRMDAALALCHAYQMHIASLQNCDWASSFSITSVPRANCLHNKVLIHNLPDSFWHTTVKHGSWACEWHAQEAVPLTAHLLFFLVCG